MSRFVPRSVPIDLLLIVMLFGVSVWWGARYVTSFRREGGKQVFYQEYFEPAVMLACGRGFVVTTPGRPTPLDDFIWQRSDSFDCRSLPADVRTGTTGMFQYPWFYLMVTVGLAWKVLGVSWSGLAPLFGVLFGLVIALAYGLFRVVVPRALAVLGSLALTTSTLHLRNLPHLRDYAKAPFVLALILILVCLVRRRIRPVMLLAFAVLYGVVLGVGYGFRADLLANIPPFVVTVLLFLPGGVTRNLGLKAAALVLAAVTFAAVAWPMTRYVVTRGGCQWHFVLLGLAPDFNDELGIDPAFYQWNPAYADMFVYTTVSSYQNRMHAPAPMDYCSHEYDVASAALLRDIVIRFPADMATRAYASVLRVLDLPFPWWDAPSPNLATWIYRPRGPLLKATAGTARLAAFVAIALIGACNLRLGLFALFFVLYFGGYPALQFANRHYFHLEFIGWWAMAFVVWQAARGITVGIRQVPRTPDADGSHEPSARRLDWKRLVVGTAQFAVIAALVAAVPVPILRAYQRRQVSELTRTLLDAPRLPVPMVPTDDGKALLLPNGRIDGLGNDPMRTAYLDVHLDLVACPAGVPLSPRYDPTYRDFDFSMRLRTMPPGTVPERVLLPVYQYFQGFDLGGAPVRCVTQVERLAIVRALPLLPVLTLPPSWQSLPFHQSVAHWEMWPPFVRGS